MDNEETQPQLTRRSWLASVGASLAMAAGATGGASAEEHGYGNSGYGAGPYGGDEQTTEPDPVVAVSTLGVADADATSATLSGSLTELTGYDSATVYFEYDQINTSLTSSTAEQRLTATGEFETTVTGLTSGTEYQFRAVAVADTETVTGETMTFTTASVDDPVLTIDRLTAADVSNERNPHVDAEISWAASISDGKLYAADLRLSGPDGLIKHWEYDLDSQTVDRTESDRIPQGARTEGTEYTADLIVYSYDGEYIEQTTTFRSQ